jgi:hypothetical protein
MKALKSLADYELSISVVLQTFITDLVYYYVC